MSHIDNLDDGFVELLVAELRPEAKLRVDSHGGHALAEAWLDDFRGSFDGRKSRLAPSAGRSSANTRLGGSTADGLAERHDLGRLQLRNARRLPHSANASRASGESGALCGRHLGGGSATASFGKGLARRLALLLLDDGCLSRDLTSEDTHACGDLGGRALLRNQGRGGNLRAGRYRCLGSTRSRPARISRRDIQRKQQHSGARKCTSGPEPGARGCRPGGALQRPRGSTASSAPFAGRVAIPAVGLAARSSQLFLAAVSSQQPNMHLKRSARGQAAQGAGKAGSRSVKVSQGDDLSRLGTPEHAGQARRDVGACRGGHKVQLLGMWSEQGDETCGLGYKLPHRWECQLSSGCRIGGRVGLLRVQMFALLRACGAAEQSGGASSCSRPTVDWDDGSGARQASRS